MSDVLLDTFLPQVLPFVRDCPQMVARGALLNAAIEFCDATHWWLHEHDPLTLVASLGHYEFDVPTDAEMAQVVAVRAAGRLLVPRSTAELNAAYPTQDWRTQQGAPAYYTQTDPDEIRLVPVPQETTAQGLTMTVALRPARDAAYLPSTLYIDWAEELGYGARARLHEMPGQPFSDPNAAVMCRGKFSQAISRAKAARNQSLTTGPLHVRMPRFV